MTRSIQLLAIDPQNDFCDLPADWWSAHPTRGAIAPSLPVAGAHRHMQRLAQWVRAQAAHIDEITVTLDSHQRFDIAHPVFWQQADGQPVAPFTSISAQQVRSAEFVPREPLHLALALAYLDALESLGRHTLIVWPVHCEIGSWGHGLHAELLDACAAWQMLRQRAVVSVFKGMNPWTEHYSALMAEVVDPTDPGTALNTVLLERLAQADLLVIAGEASSHCVRATVEHLVQYLPPGHAQRLLLLTDCMGPVAGFESAEQDFFAAMRAQGVQFATSDTLTLTD